MDDLIQVLMFVGAFIVFIVSAVKKQKKKTGGKAMTFESVVESFLGEPVKSEPQINEQQAWFEQQVEEDIIVEAEKPIEEGIDAIPDKEEPGTSYIGEEGIDETDFNLRDAVIYSEILNRKTY